MSDDYTSTFYNENGSFKPLTGENGNVDGDLAYLRNTYMEAEKEYFLQLLKDPVMLGILLDISKLNSDEIFRMACDLRDKLEFGQLETREELEEMASMSPKERDKFHMKKLEQAEAKLCILFAAARDKVKLLELVKTPEYEEEKEEEQGRSFSR